VDYGYEDARIYDKFSIETLVFSLAPLSENAGICLFNVEG
jgi:hypothetical protein